MSLKLKVKGLASGKEFEVKISSEDLGISLMDFLIKNGFRIASSCGGEGVCKKCVVNETLVSCQVSVREFLDNGQAIEIGYL